MSSRLHTTCAYAAQEIVEADSRVIKLGMVAAYTPDDPAQPIHTAIAMGEGSTPDTVAAFLDELQGALNELRRDLADKGGPPPRWLLTPAQ